MKYLCKKCGNTSSFKEERLLPYDPPSPNRPNGSYLKAVKFGICTHCDSPMADMGEIKVRDKGFEKEGNAMPQPKLMGKLRSTKEVFWTFKKIQENGNVYITGFSGGSVITVREDKIKPLET